MMRDTLVKDLGSKPNSSALEPNSSALEIELLSCSAGDYVNSASASSHNLGEYKTVGISAHSTYNLSVHNLNYDECSALLKKAAVKLGAEVVADVKEAVTIKSDEDIKGRFELFMLMRGTALIPVDKKDDSIISKCS